MKEIFDIVSRECSKKVTNAYSTSFSLATKMLAPTIRQDIYNIYGFVRFADEIVDSFHGYEKKTLFNRFEEDLEHALLIKLA
jgi:phytoene/squalene synthetase